MVIEVCDGDTLRVWLKHKLWGNLVKTVRIWGIDAPEKNQPCGSEAKARCSELCLYNNVTVIPTGAKTYDRLVARVILPDGRDLEATLVADGMAWHYVKYAKDADDLARLQDEAKKAGRGLWGLDAPIPPWEWRRIRREK